MGYTQASSVFFGTELRHTVLYTWIWLEIRQNCRGEEGGRQAVTDFRLWNTQLQTMVARTASKDTKRFSRKVVTSTLMIRRGLSNPLLPTRVMKCFLASFRGN